MIATETSLTQPQRPLPPPLPVPTFYSPDPLPRLDNDDCSIDFAGIKDCLAYFFEYIPRSSLCVLWPARTGTSSVRIWNIDEVFMLLSELGPYCSIHDSGRYREPKYDPKHRTLI
jgi:hypothetical protein